METGYITLEEAATLESLSYEGFRSRIKRTPEKFRIMMENNPNGGNDKILVSIASLTKQAKQKYKAQIKKQSSSDEEEIPWWVYVDYNWYKEKYQKHFYQAVEVAKYIDRYINKELEMSSSEFEEFLSKKVSVSTRTARRYIADYFKAMAWASDEELETGESCEYYKILAVARKPKEENTFPCLTEEMQAYIENIYYEENFARNNNPLTNLYEDFVELAEIKGWEKVASYDTILRYCDYLDQQDGKGARDLAAKGLRHWKNKWMMKRYRDVEALQVLEVVQGDVHTFDCWVSVKRANGKLQAIRPALVAWIDMRSRCLVGWLICECPDAEIMKQSLLNVIYPKENKDLPYGVPRYLLIDNGKEYTAQTLTGRPRNVRVCFDEDAKGFYRSMGVEDDMRSLPYQPWSKAQIERFFGTVCNKFTKRMDSYTGTLTASKTASKINRDIQGMLDKGDLMDIETFAEYFESWVVTKYHSKKHRGLMTQGEEIPAPIGVWNNGEKYLKAAPPMDYAISLLMKGDTRKVTNMGIQRTIEGKTICYTHQELARYQGQRVQFKYFPEDITRVLVYDESGKRICEAVSYELLHIAPKMSEAALEEHMRDQKRQQREVRDTIGKRRKTYEERQLDYEQAGKKVVTPKLDMKAQKITAMVHDNRYREDKKAEKEKAITHADIKQGAQEMTNDYLKKKADEAFKLLG